MFDCTAAEELIHRVSSTDLSPLELLLLHHLERAVDHIGAFAAYEGVLTNFEIESPAELAASLTAADAHCEVRDVIKLPDKPLPVKYNTAGAVMPRHPYDRNFED